MHLPRRRHPGLRRSALDRLLDEIGFSPSRDHVYVLGDLVNRGPASLGDAAAAARPRRGGDLRARQPRLAPARRRRRRAAAPPQRHARRHPRRARPRGLARLAAAAPHGGVRARLADAARRRRPAVGPGDRRSQLAAELEQACASGRRASSSAAMFGNEPTRWSDSLAGDERLRFTLNTLTRIRFVADDGTLEFADQGRRRRRPAGLSAVVRRPRPAHRRRADRVRPLVVARPGRARPTCSASTPAASGAASSPRCASTAAAASSIQVDCAPGPHGSLRKRPRNAPAT